MAFRRSHGPLAGIGVGFPVFEPILLARSRTGPGSTATTTATISYGVPLRPGYETTPFSIAGQTVCSRGWVEDGPGGSVFWHDGETTYGPKYAGMRCIRLP